LREASDSRDSGRTPSSIASSSPFSIASGVRSSCETRVKCARATSSGARRGLQTACAGAPGQRAIAQALHADVSHELRTPLAILKGELEAIEDGVRPLSRESLASLNHEAAALGKLVDDLYQLALADVGALAYRKERVEIAQLLQEAVESLGERFNERRLSVETDLAPARAFADRRPADPGVSQPAGELAALYRCGGRVRIVARRDAGKIRIVVEDSDPAVPAQAMPHLFDRFYRCRRIAQPRQRRSGLGLAICRSIVEAHDGEIKARRSPLGGWPWRSRSRWRNEHHPHRRGRAQAGGADGGLPEGLGFAAHCIADGLEVVPWVREHSPDLVLLDLMLPGRDGLEICRELRGFSDVPVVMVTAKSRKSIASSASSSARTTTCASRSACASWWRE